MNIQHYILSSDNPEALQALNEAAIEIRLHNAKEREDLPLPTHYTMGQSYADFIQPVQAPDLIIVMADTLQPAAQCPADFAFAQSAYEYWDKKVEVRLLLVDTTNKDKSRLFHRYPVFVPPAPYVNDYLVVVNATDDLIANKRVVAGVNDFFFEKPETFARWMGTEEINDYIDKMNGLTTVNVVLGSWQEVSTVSDLLKSLCTDDRIAVVRFLVIDEDGFVTEVSIMDYQPKPEVDTGLDDSDSPEETAPVVLNWHGASLLLQQGHAVRRLSWGLNTFISVTFGQVISADRFWSPHNKLAAEENGGALQVNDYYTQCDGQNVSQYFLSYADEQANDWVEATAASVLVGAVGREDGAIELQYDILPGVTERPDSIYEVLMDKNPVVVLIANNSFIGLHAATHNSVLTDMKKQLMKPCVVGQRTYVGYIADSDLWSSEFVTSNNNTSNIEEMKTRLLSYADHYTNFNVVVLRDFVAPDALDLDSPFVKMLEEVIPKGNTWSAFAISDYAYDGNDNGVAV